MSLQTGLDLIRLKRHIRLKPSELNEMQNKKLRAILRHAYQNVAFYHRKFRKANLRPDDVESIEDLRKIPMTTRSELQSARFHELVANNVDLRNCVKRRTSGSIGQPLTVALDPGAVRFEDALWLRAMFENGLRIWDRLAVVHDPRGISRKSGNWLQNFGFMSRKYISILEDADQQVRLLEEYKPEVLKGYPSSLTIIAELAKKKHVHITPRLIFTGSELLNRSARRFLGSEFDAQVIDCYGCNEFSLLAWECPQHMGYHINVDSVVLEFIDGDEEVSFGERGEVVCTGLVNQAMPLIRYRVGDVAVPCEEECPCGRTLPLMRIVEGRMDDFLVTLDGKPVSPLIFFPYPFKNVNWMKQFRIVQERRDKLTVELAIKAGSGYTRKILEEARLELVKLFGAGMQVEFKTVEIIGCASSGKMRKIISRVPKETALSQVVSSPTRRGSGV